MTTEEPIYRALARLEHREMAPCHREILRPAFAALHGGSAIALPDTVVNLIRMLDPELPAPNQ
jgi:hypothetical protein